MRGGIFKSGQDFYAQSRKGGDGERLKHRSNRTVRALHFWNARSNHLKQTHFARGTKSWSNRQACGPRKRRAESLWTGTTFRIRAWVDSKFTHPTSVQPMAD